MSFDLQREATKFGNEVQALLDGVLPSLAGADPALRQIAVTTGVRTVLIEVGSEAAGKAVTVPLLGNGEKVADLFVEYRLVADSAEQYLAVARSEFGLYIERNPLLRLDFRRDSYSVPCSHWNVHAERGAVSRLLTRSNPGHPGELSKVHLPVGGFRMRPCLEDFLHLLLHEFRFDETAGARQLINDGRVGWRRKQLAAMVRDDAETAAEVLDRLGYHVAPPKAGHPVTRIDRLTAW